MLIKNAGTPINYFDKRKRISSIIGVDDEIKFLLNTWNINEINDKVYIKVEREESMWILNEAAHFQEGKIFIAPEPKCDPEDSYIKFNFNIQNALFS